MAALDKSDLLSVNRVSYVSWASWYQLLLENFQQCLVKLCKYDECPFCFVVGVRFVMLATLLMHVEICYLVLAVSLFMYR